MSPNKADTSDKSYSSWQFNCLIICINSLWQLGILHILIQFCPSPGTCLTILAWQCAVCFKLIIKWQFHSNKGVFQLVRGKSIYYYLCIRNRLCDWRKLLHLANEMEKIHKHLLETSEGWNLPEEVFFLFSYIKWLEKNESILTWNSEVILYNKQPTVYNWKVKQKHLWRGTKNRFKLSNNVK